LSDDIQKQLFSMIANNTDDFKKRNKISIREGQMYSERRWEFVRKLEKLSEKALTSGVWCSIIMEVNLYF